MASKSDEVGETKRRIFHVSYLFDTWVDRMSHGTTSASFEDQK